MTCSNQTCPKKKECSSYDPQSNNFEFWLIENGEFKCDGFNAESQELKNVKDLFRKAGLNL